MKAFEYAAPESEQEVLALLSHERGRTEILAGGTDLVGMMKRMLTTPDRVVSLKQVAGLKDIVPSADGLRIGVMATLEDLADSPYLAAFPGIQNVVTSLGSLQLQSQGTLGGELFQRPRCWYFRDGHGLTAGRGRQVQQGDNRYHAIFGNTGPAKFVSPSRLAPALISLGAIARVIGPADVEENYVPLELLYKTPQDDSQREHALQPNQLVTHITLPEIFGAVNGSYEVRHGEGPDEPLVTAAASLVMQGPTVAAAKIVLGHVAPTPWLSPAAVRAIVGERVTPETAEAAGNAAVESATPLADNGYKVQLARVAVKRAILNAAGLETGGF